MKKNSRNLIAGCHFVLAISVGLIFGANATFAQSQVGKIAAVQKRIDEIEKAPPQKDAIDVSKIGQDSGFEKLATFSTAEGQVVEAQNAVKYEEGGGLLQRYFFDEKGELIAAKNESHSIDPDGSQLFTTETTYFDSGAYIGMVAKEGQFKKGEAIAPAKLKPSEVDQFNPDPADAVAIYLNNLQPASQIKRLVKAFANFKGTLPNGLLLETISPDGRFIVSWKKMNPAEETCQFTLHDLVGNKEIVPLPKGYAPGTNHIYHSAAWSAGSIYFVFINDVKWSTESAPLVKMDPAAGTAVVIGDLYQAAGEYAWAELKKAQNPFTKNRDTIHGFVQIQSIGDDGVVNLLLDSQSKFEGPEHNVRSLITLNFASGKAQVTGLRILSADEDLPSDGDLLPAPTAKLEPPAGWAVSADKLGAISGTTPFSVESMQALYPAQKVVAGTEEFEEGGERPVIYVKNKDEVILTLVSGIDKSKLEYIYTNSPLVSTASGINVGDSYGEVFERLAAGTEVEGLTGDAVAQAPDLPNVTLRFSPSDPNTEVGTVPPFDQLKRWLLHTIEWTPGTAVIKP
jgi:Protein of unknown function (DUF1131)